MIMIWLQVLLQLFSNQIKWEQFDIQCGEVLDHHVHVKLTTVDMVGSALSVTAVFSKQCVKPFVEGLPGILSFIASHYQMNFASLIANWYVYWDLFAEVDYVRDRGFNVLHLDRHGGMIGAQFSLKSGYKGFDTQSLLLASWTPNIVAMGGLAQEQGYW